MACPIKSAVSCALDAGLLLDAEGRVVYKNAVARRIFGGDDDENDNDENNLERQNIASLIDFDDAARQTGMDNAVLWSSILKDLEHKPKQLDAKACAGDKSSFPAIISVTKIVKCGCTECGGGDRERDDADVDDDPHPHPHPAYTFLAYVREVDDQLQRYIRLLEKENTRLQTAKYAMEASFDAFISINSKGIIQSVNEAAVTSFGYSREEFIGANVSMITGGEHPEKHDQYLRNYMRTGTKKVMGKKRELPARRKDGTEFTIELGLIEIGASGIEDERLFCGFIKDLSRQKESVATTAAMIDASLDAMFQIDEKGIIQIVNSAATNILGWSRHEFLGRNISMVVGGVHARNHDQYLKRYLETGEKRAMGKKRELTATRKDGTSMPIELELTEIVKSTGERLFCGFVRDLTAQKEKEKLTITMIESSFDPMIQINSHGLIQLCNKAACDIFGWSREELMGQNVSMIVGGEHQKQHDKYLARYLATGVKRVMGKRRELPARRKDGTEFPIKLGLTEVKLSSSGERYFCGFVQDMSQHKLDEQRIRRKQELTEGMINASFDPMFQINPQGTIQMVNQSAIDQFGWTEEELIGSNVSKITGAGHAKKHDGYLSRYIQTGEKRVIGKRRQTMARRKDGSEFPIELGVSEVNTCAEERIFCGYVRDVRREKYDEQDLKEKEKLSETFIELAPDPLFGIDEHGIIHRANLAACQYFGWTKEGMLGNSIKMIMTVEFARKNASDITRFIGASLRKNKEVEIKKHDGSVGKVLLLVEEVSGTFPILLSLSHRGGERGTRLYAVFVSTRANMPSGMMGKFVRSLNRET